MMNPSKNQKTLNFFAKNKVCCHLMLLMEKKVIAPKNIANLLFLHRQIKWKKNKFFRRNRFDSAVFTP